MLGYTETENDYIMLLEHMNEACLLKETIVDSWTQLGESEIKKYLADILSALSYIHGNRIIHADIKLENILIHKGPNTWIAKLCDFGLSMIMYEGKSTVQNM